MYSYWSVGDGRKIDAWNEAWLDDGVIINERVNIPPHLLGMKVIELVDSDGKWNWSLITNWLPIEMIKKIAAMLPPRDEHGRDERMVAGDFVSTKGMKIL
ncbi:hypothetical protein TSUD_349050 [Trifolium subterraneum]|uniref:Reverse transcriptase zinc-binding domain-containing protein n=1 Tax=Trifolium subterraneum TaxID=3900 RepID=A0A2Z6NZ66_TRISU|nr:hypothetical protein TSUD_349050 [Trifolium subterraneum]